MTYYSKRNEKQTTRGGVRKESYNKRRETTKRPSTFKPYFIEENKFEKTSYRSSEKPSKPFITRPAINEVFKNIIEESQKFISEKKSNQVQFTTLTNASKIESAGASFTVIFKTDKKNRIIRMFLTQDTRTGLYTFIIVDNTHENAPILFSRTDNDITDAISKYVPTILESSLNMLMK